MSYLAFLVVCIIGLLVIPLPSPVVDGLISLNICISAVLLMRSLDLPRALDAQVKVEAYIPSSSSNPSPTC